MKIKLVSRDKSTVSFYECDWCNCTKDKLTINIINFEGKETYEKELEFKVSDYMLIFIDGINYHNLGVDFQ